MGRLVDWPCGATMLVLPVESYIADFYSLLISCNSAFVKNKARDSEFKLTSLRAHGAAGAHARILARMLLLMLSG